MIIQRELFFNDRVSEGLCRTGEIFGVKELVIGSIRVLEDQQFLNLSMTAHKWLHIKQVSRNSRCSNDRIHVHLGTRERIKRLFIRYASSGIYHYCSGTNSEQSKFI